ncbi:MAG: 50S ribosomal protein L6 [Alphaproteobacteria bacterium]|nr:50S ribosomal protein L6 [Alphaproteobacteria bacterium]
MSRIGKNPVEIPQGVTAKIENNFLVFSGAKGVLSSPCHSSVSVEIQENKIVFVPKDTTKAVRSLWGTLRSLANNAAQGVAHGVTHDLVLKGVGFRAAVKGRSIEMNLGFSHPVIYQLPEGVDAKCTSQVEITLSGCDKQLVGQVAAEIKKLRPVEPYKGKGIRTKDQYVRIKEGKKK